MAKNGNRVKTTEVVEPVVGIDETPAYIGANEEDKVSSVAELMQRAEEDSRVDTKPVEGVENSDPVSNTETDEDEDEDSRVDTKPVEGVENSDPVSNTETDEDEDEDSRVEPIADYSSVVTDIVKNKTMPLLDKIENIIRVLPDTPAKVVKSILAIYNICSKVKTRVPTLLNPEQKAFVRSFIKLCNEPTEEFNKAMKYINWIYKQLSDTKVLDREELVIIRGVSPIDPTISTLFIAGKDDKELVTYVYLSTIIDFRANAKTTAEKSKKADILRITSDTILTEDIVNKINSFYDN